MGPWVTVRKTKASLCLEKNLLLRNPGNRPITRILDKRNLIKGLFPGILFPEPGNWIHRRVFASGSTGFGWLQGLGVCLGIVSFSWARAQLWRKT